MSSKNLAAKTSTNKSKKSAKSSPSSVKKITYPILILIGIIFYYYCNEFNFVQDDSYITYRYVKNFTEGNGLVFNTGERVEGYTCFLWVILLSFIKIIGIDFISFSQYSGIIFSILTLFFIYKISSTVFLKNKNEYYDLTMNLAAVVLTASNGAFAYWSISGMETGMFTFLITLAVYLYLNENLKRNTTIPYSSLVFLSASLTRPEGVLIFLITVLHKIIFILKSKPGQARDSNKLKLILSKDNIVWLLIYLIPGIIYMIWRYSYFGYLLPNTYYAKTGSSIEYLKAGWDYFLEFAKNYGLYGALVVIILINLKSKERYYEYLYLIMIFFIFSVYIIIIGGDVLKPSRFFVPIVPIFYILVQESMHQIINILSKRKSPAFSPIPPIIITIIFAYITYKIPYESIKKQSELENGLVDKMKTTGLWLKNKSTESGRTLTVAASTIGAISYFSDVNLIDMLGLTDKEIAHNPKTIEELSITAVGWKERNYNADYVVSRKPDYMYFSTGIKPSAYGERALFLNDEFRNSYYAYYSKDVFYKRKSDSEITSNKITEKNPNYSVKFIYDYVDGLNTMRDKTKLNEAINKFNSSIKQAPKDFSYPYQFIGEIYIQNKNKDKAFENFKKAADLDDYNVLCHYYLYQLYLEKGDTAKARMSFEKIQKYSPDLLK